MKNKAYKILILVLALVGLSTFSSFAFADDSEGATSSPEPSAQSEQLEDISKSLVEIKTLLETPVATDIEIEPSEVEQGTTTLQALKISANQTSGLHSILLRLIGDYNPIVKDYLYTSNSGYQSHSIEIQPDYSWIASALLFIVIIYSFFRLVGILLGGSTYGRR